MSKKRNRNILVIAALLVVLVALYFFFSLPSPISWAETYADVKGQPYGSQVMKELIRKSHPDDSFTEISDSLSMEVDISEVKAESNYYFIGSDLFLDSLELDFLLRWVTAGHNAFLSSNNFSYPLLDTLLHFPMEYETEYGEELALRPAPELRTYRTDTIYMNLHAGEPVLDSVFSCVFLRDHSPRLKSWRYFPDYLESREGATITALGFFEDEYVNFIRVPYGEGSFYLHSTPLAFSNYYLQEEAGFDYLAQTLSMAGKGDHYWDGYNRLFQWVPNQMQGSGTRYEHEEGPLSFILSERGLRTAWFVILTLGFLYLLFGARRKQRPIPVMHPPANTSLEYAETIGKMFRLEKDHQRLIQLKMELFLSWVRERYSLRTYTENPEQEQKLIEKLAVKSDIPLAEVEAIFAAYSAQSDEKDPEGKRLIRFHRMLEAFYKKAR